jgi:hypothetical protein
MLIPNIAAVMSGCTPKLLTTIKQEVTFLLEGTDTEAV